MKKMSLREYLHSINESGKITDVSIYGEYIKTILEENQKNKVKNVDNISEVEVKDYIKSLKNIKK